MAVYKPTYCYPYLEPVDLTVPNGTKYFTCQIDTSNIAITGYKMELFDENNKQIFPLEANKNLISPIEEALSGDEESVGLNGSELRLPFVQRWNDTKKINSYNSIYFKATDSIEYFQKDDFTESVAVVNGQLYVKTQQGANLNDPVMVDKSYLFIGDRFLAGKKIYLVTYDGLSETEVKEGDIYYIKGGIDNAGKCYQLVNNTIEPTTDVWCDITEKSLPLSNNGNTYKWKVTLYSGNKLVKRKVVHIRNIEVRTIDYSQMADNEFNTILTSGTILGSTEDRIQGPISDKIYAKQWLQLLRKDSNDNWLQVGTRTYIESYSQTLGCIYPISGDSRGFDNSDLYDTKTVIVNDEEKTIPPATHFAVYKYSNDPNSITSQNSVDQSVNFALIEQGMTYQTGSYSYEIVGRDKIDAFNNYCKTSSPEKAATTPLCDYNYNEDNDTYEAVHAGESVLIWNKKSSPKSNPLTGYFTISFSTSDSKDGKKIPKFVFDMVYAYRKVSSYIGKVFFVKEGSFANENIVSKAEATGEQDVASLGFPIPFNEEEPLEIYPDAKDKLHGEIFKNSVENGKGTVYISPFVGLQAGARFYVSDGTVIKAADVDTSVWKVTYDTALDSKPYSAIEAPKYEIRTNFKSSDETPFYAYDSPRLVPWATQGLRVKSSTGETFLLEYQGQVLTVATNVSTDVNGRFVEVYGQYLQAQNISWTSYRWLLVDQYGQTIQDTGKRYDGVIRTTFYGLDGPTLEEVEGGTALRNQYYIVLLVEDELGNSLALGMEIKVAIKPSSLPVVFSGEFDCKTQAVKLKIQDYGYPTLSQDEENKAVVLNSTDGVIYTNADSQKTGYVSINGKKGTLKAADQVGIPIEGAQLAHFFAKNTTEIADLSMAPKKLATNREGNIEFHTKFKLDANYCGEFFKYGVDVFDNFGKAKRLYLSLGLPNNFKTNFHESGNLQIKRRLIYCKVQCGEAAASLGGLELFPTPTNEAYWLQPKEWIEPTTGNLTQHTDFEYLDFVYPFVKNGDVVTEDKNYTNIDESINTKGQRNIGVCCLQETRQPSGQYNVWTDLKRIQVETPVGYRIVQTAEQATWNDSYYWVEGWDPNNDTLMERVKRHPSIEGKTFVVDCYMKNIDKFYNLDFRNDSKFELSYLGMTKSGIWTIKDKINELGQITLRITDVTGG